MELIFIRHGQGTHTSNLPNSLGMRNPSLTSKGMDQAEKLRSALPLTAEDVVVVSPTLRTLQTASVWSGNVDCIKVVHPLAAPRIFPAHADAVTSCCDELLDTQTMQEEFPDFHFAQNLDSSLWKTGINLLPEYEFSCLAEDFFGFCRSFQRKRIYVITHDGTITSYRQLISGQLLTRQDFLAETESFRLVIG